MALYSVSLAGDLLGKCSSLVRACCCACEGRSSCFRTSTPYTLIHFLELALSLFVNDGVLL